MNINTSKLDQLTSLRFFAAFMIVLHHSEGLFGIGKFEINLGQGVSFFFVLSGFILAYVYPKLETWAEISRFCRARVARIWPAHIASCLFGLWLIHYNFDVYTFIANLFLVQAWIPLSDYYFSYNMVAWSVSTELFFYFAFPVILYRWESNWRLKAAFFVVLFAAFISLMNFLALPDYGSGNGMRVTEHGLIYISPLSRIFEFFFGVYLLFAWQRRRDAGLSRSVGTGLEAGAVVLCGLSMYYMSEIAAWSGRSILGPSMEYWLSHCGSMFAFGFLIYVMARGHGWISALLAHPVPVVLGEISFSLYLIHVILLIYIRNNIADFANISSPMMFAGFITILLLSSYLAWALIEMPGRRLLLGRQKIHATTIMRKSWHEHFNFSRETVLAGVALGLFVGVINWNIGGLHYISRSEADGMTPAALKKYVGADFGSQFTLRGLDVRCEGEGLRVNLSWESRSDRKLDLTNAVHLVNDAGEILGQADYKQSNRRKRVAQGDVWLDSMLIPNARLTAGMTRLAIGIFDDSISMLAIARDDTDWGGHRLLIPIVSCGTKV